MGQKGALYVNAKQELSTVGSCVDDFPELRELTKVFSRGYNGCLGFCKIPIRNQDFLLISF